MKRSTKLQSLIDWNAKQLREDRELLYDNHLNKLEGIARKPITESFSPSLTAYFAEGLAYWYHREALQLYMEQREQEALLNFARSAYLISWSITLLRFSPRPKQGYTLPELLPLFYTHLIYVGLDTLALAVLREALRARQAGLPFPEFHPGGRGPRYLPLVTVLWRDWSGGEIDFHRILNEDLEKDVAPIETQPCYQSIIDHYLDADGSLFEAALDEAAALHLKETKASTNSRTADFESKAFSFYPVELLLAIELRARKGLSAVAPKHELFHVMDYSKIRLQKVIVDPALEASLAQLRQVKPDFPVSLV